MTYLNHGLAIRQRLVVDDGGERKRTTSFNTDASANGGVSAANSLKTSCMQLNGVVSDCIISPFPNVCVNFYCYY
jgi:hypothetical protein